MLFKDNLLDGKRALVTGGSLGLGKEISKTLLKLGASVAICSRGEKNLHQAHGELSKELQGLQKFESFICDVSKPADVKKMIGKVLATLGGLDILVSNAGIYGPKGPFEDNDWEEWKRAFDINFYGTVTVCREVTPHLKKQKHGKIIILSGGGATKPMPNLTAYASSKAAVVRFAESIGLELKEYGIDVNTLAPGALNTRLLDEVLQAGPSLVGEKFYEASRKQAANGGAPLDRGANLCAYLASHLSDGITGKLISAIWDPWENFEDKKQELDTTDIYTLRRIIPEERGFQWEKK